MPNPLRHAGPPETSATFLRRSALAALSAAMFVTLALTGCVTSTSPVLLGAKPELGERGQIHAFFVGNSDRSEDLGTPTFRWRDDRYLLLNREKLPFSEFTIHPLEGEDRLLQILATEPREFQYYVVRPIAQGAYSLIPVLPGVLDEATREKLCKSKDSTPCHVTTPEQLYAFARAVAHDPSSKPTGLVVMVKPTRRQHR
jgi:hypothetical protein